MQYLLALFILISAPAIAADYDVRRVHVTGEAEAETDYDEAVINLNIQSEDKDLDRAKSGNNGDVKKLLRLVDRYKIDKVDVKTSAYRAHPKYRFINKERVLDGYSVSTTMRVLMRDIDKSNKFLDDLAKAGFERIYNVSYKLSDKKRKKLEAELKVQALKNAKEKAEVLAEQVGDSIGKALEITDSVRHVSPPRHFARMETMALSADSSFEKAPEVTAGKAKITQTINATFELK